MNLKTKAIGLLAGSALALSVASGAMAEPAQVTLTNDSTGDCFVSANNGTFDLGTWTWNGSAYEHTIPGDASLDVNVTQDISSQNVDCVVTALASDLTERDGVGAVVAGGAVIPAADVTTTVNGGVSPVTTPGGVAGTTISVDASINTLGTLPPADYAGTITLDASTSAG